MFELFFQHSALNFFSYIATQISRLKLLLLLLLSENPSKVNGVLVSKARLYQDVTPCMQTRNKNFLLLFSSYLHYKRLFSNMGFLEGK
jgi:hypothetical protein